MKSFSIRIQDQNDNMTSDTLVVTGNYDPAKVSIEQLTTLVRERIEGAISEVVGVTNLRLVQKESLIG